MVKQGPVPAFIHGIYEYLGGAALIVLPLVVDYKSGAATAVSIVLGVLLIFLTATTALSTSLINQIPLAAHIILDYVLVVVLIASPFLFGFNGRSTPTAIFIAGGVLHLLVSIATRYRRPEAAPAPAESPKRERKRGERTALDSGASAGERDDEIPEFEPPPRERRP